MKEKRPRRKCGHGLAFSMRGARKSGTDTGAELRCGRNRGMEREKRKCICVEFMFCGVCSAFVVCLRSWGGVVNERRLRPTMYRKQRKRVSNWFGSRLDPDPVNFGVISEISLNLGLRCSR